jgi:hypothetical protein
MVTAQLDVDTDVADAQDQDMLAPAGDIAHFRSKRRWCRSAAGARKAQREELGHQAEALQSPMFDF